MKKKRITLNPKTLIPEEELPDRGVIWFWRACTRRQRSEMARILGLPDANQATLVAHDRDHVLKFVTSHRRQPDSKGEEWPGIVLPGEGGKIPSWERTEKEITVPVNEGFILEDHRINFEEDTPEGDSSAPILITTAQPTLVQTPLKDLTPVEQAQRIGWPGAIFNMFFGTTPRTVFSGIMLFFVLSIFCCFCTFAAQTMLYLAAGSP